MLTLPQLAIGDRIVVQHRNRPQSDIFVVVRFTAEGHPVTRMKALGGWGVESNFPSHLDGLELVDVVKGQRLPD